jgi:predicted ATPase/class 3 adenylate cyclase
VRRELPAGTVTFLFTDVEGSSKLLHELGAGAYAQKLAEHRRVVREACTARNGVEVDTQGDAFFLAFPTAPAAVEAARAITDALESGPISLRIGLHTGTPLLTDEGYAGEDVHLAARLSAAGHGGQVLLSQATRQLVGGADLVDLGEHRLKDISEPVEIYQLGNERFPPLRTISNTNLPNPVSSFVGRQREVAELLARIANGARILTLTGPAGSGKTRLALEAAATLVPRYKAGVFWIALATVRDPGLVTEQIAQTLGAKNALAEHIGRDEMLLLLDNLEQVVEAAPDLVDLVADCPNLTFLCTSRELLRVRGEIEYEVLPLAHTEAVDLFCARCGFAPSNEIEELCARLDNLPLAVELAAARTKALSPAQILERLSQRLDLLKGGRDADPRQQTLRATIQWSYELLSEDEKRLFRRLAVFVGGFTLDAAEEICKAELDPLQALVEKSLVRRTNHRFSMLETIREYASERLHEAGERGELSRRHAEVFTQLAEAQPRMRRAELVVKLADDEGNLRAALSFAGGGREPELMLRLAGALWRFWWVRDQDKEARAWLEEANAHGESGPPPLRAEVLRGLGVVVDGLGDPPRGWELEEEALGLYREIGDPEGVGACLNNLGRFALEQGDLEQATSLLEDSIECLEQLGAGRSLAPRNNLAVVLVRKGDFAKARQLFEDVLAGAKRESDDLVVADIWVELAWIAGFEGSYEEAARLVRAALPTYVRIGASLDSARCMFLAALVCAGGERLDLAARLVGAASATRQRLGRPALLEDIYVRPLQMLEQELGREPYVAAYDEGAAMSFEDAIELTQSALA